MHMSENQRASARPRPVLRGAEVEDAIDRAVRQMMQVDPRPGLGRRVQSRIAMPAGRRSLYSTPYMAVAGALAMLVLAVGLLRPDTARDPASPGSAMDEAAPAADSFASGQAGPAPSRPADSLAAGRSVSRPQPPYERAERVSPLPLIAPKDPKAHAEAIPMPEIVNLFGAGGNTVTGANFSGRADAIATPPARAAESPLQVVVLPMPPLRIELLTITPLPVPGKER